MQLFLLTRTSLMKLFCVITALLIEFFTVCTKLAEMAILYSKDLITAKKKLPPGGLDLVLQILLV